MTHLQETEMGYFAHLRRAWSIAFVLLIHGLFPNIWKHKASEMIGESHHEEIADDSSSPVHPSSFR